MIKEKLLDKNYYMSKLSMFMKESYGIPENVDLMLDWMKSIDSLSTYITNVLDIWNENYKKEMEEKFGLMYYQRPKDEIFVNLRGTFKANSGTIDITINNESIEFDNTTYNYVYTQKYNEQTTENFFYCANQHVNSTEKFSSSTSYFKIEINEDYELTKVSSSPESEELYEKISNGQYRKSEDENYITDKNYYRLNEDKNKYELIDSPSDLKLFSGNIYRFKFKSGTDTEDYIITNPEKLGLYEDSQGTVPSSDPSFDPNKTYYAKVFNYNSNGEKVISYTKIVPNSMFMPIYKKEGNDFVRDQSNAFTSGTYYINYDFKYAIYETTNFGNDIEMLKTSPSYKYSTPYATEDGDGEPFKMLDIIASIVGCSRNNNIIIDGKVETLKPLSNEDLLDLIKIKLIQNNYKGTTKEILDLYKEKLNYNIFIVLDKGNTTATEHDYHSAYCKVYLEDFYMDEKGNTQYLSDNIKKLFKYSDLFIQSMGITYDFVCISDIDNLLILDRDYTEKNEWAVYHFDSPSEEEAANRSASTIKLG